MTTMKIFSVTATMLLLATIAAGPPAHARPAAASGIKKVLLAIPALTGEQKTRINDLANAARMRSAPLREQVSAGRKYIASLWAADALDKEAIARKNAELDAAVAKLRGIWAEFFVALHDILTTPQRAWLAAHVPALHSDTSNDWTAAQECCPCGQH